MGSRSDLTAAGRFQLQFPFSDVAFLSAKSSFRPPLLTPHSHLARHTLTNFSNTSRNFENTRKCHQDGSTSKRQQTRSCSIMRNQLSHSLDCREHRDFMVSLDGTSPPLPPSSSYVVLTASRYLVAPLNFTFIRFKCQPHH